MKKNVQQKIQSKSNVNTILNKPFTVELSVSKEKGVDRYKSSRKNEEVNMEDVDQAKHQGRNTKSIGRGNER